MFVNILHDALCWAPETCFRIWGNGPEDDHRQKACACGEDIIHMNESLRMTRINSILALIGSSNAMIYLYYSAYVIRSASRACQSRMPTVTCDAIAPGLPQ